MITKKEILDAIESREWFGKKTVKALTALDEKEHKMTNSELKNRFDEEYKRIASGGVSHRLAQLGALDKCYGHLWRLSGQGDRCVSES